VTEQSIEIEAVTLTRTFRVKTDERFLLGGSDWAIDPIEFLMSAFGRSIAAGRTKQADLRELRSLPPKRQSRHRSFTAAIWNSR
jgi:hypothetical protein